MKTTTAEALIAAYDSLYPGEHAPVEGVDLAKHQADMERTFSNWLARYKEFPEATLATTNWEGKVTKALFKALEIKQPRTKATMATASMNATATSCPCSAKSLAACACCEDIATTRLP